MYISPVFSRNLVQNLYGHIFFIALSLCLQIIKIQILGKN